VLLEHHPDPNHYRNYLRDYEMAIHQFNKLSAQPTVEEIGHRVQEIGSRMVGFKSSLDYHLEGVDGDIGDSLAMLAGLSEYMSMELITLGEQLSVIHCNPA
jgi:hypothetical protein